VRSWLRHRSYGGDMAAESIGGVASQEGHAHRGSGARAEGHRRESRSMDQNAGWSKVGANRWISPFHDWLSHVFSDRNIP